MPACQSDEPTKAAGANDAKPGSTAQCDLNNPAIAAAPVTTPHALHNVHPLTSKLISGAVPENDAAFDELKAMGIKTIITVDGATPNVDAAAKRGMRYVHIPITYAEVTEAQAVEIARAVRDLPGPIYIHCHHGKHRSPAAAVVVGVALGLVTPEQGVAFMKKAGTGANYTGLYACAAEAVAFDDATLARAPHDFPSVRKPKGMTAAMVDIDACYERLGEIKAAGWKTPADHPDLVPVSEAGQLADHYRNSGEDAKAKALGADFAHRLAEAVHHATALEDALVQNADKVKLEKLWSPVAVDCKSCHAVYRDKR
ncbi:MAG: hypothetical protein ACREJO_05340 [Phycisphaerales bacterium]